MDSLGVNLFYGFNLFLPFTFKASSVISLLALFFIYSSLPELTKVNSMDYGNQIYVLNFTPK